MIDHNTPIEIRAVTNGFIVTPAFTAGQRGTTMIVTEDVTMVFESRTMLLQWLSVHFDLTAGAPTP